VLPFIVQSHSLILLEAKAIAAITSAMKMLLALELQAGEKAKRIVECLRPNLTEQCPVKK
jgi:hypothetical protein